MTTLDPALAERLPTSDVPAWVVVAALAVLALAMVAANVSRRCDDADCPICKEETP